MTLLGSSSRCAVIVLVAASALTASAAPIDTHARPEIANAAVPQASRLVAPPARRDPPPATTRESGAALGRGVLIPPARALRAGAVATPLRIEIPSIGLDIAVVDVGMTSNDVMDAPEGGPADPVWQQAFWYRGSAVPGQASTALIAGHIDDPLGRPGAFARLDQLHAGAPITVRNSLTGLTVQYVVVATADYPLASTTDRAVLVRMYGQGPANGDNPEPSADGRAHLTLVTCAGTFDDALRTHDHRLAVFATRVA